MLSAEQTGIRQWGIVGGVSANRLLRRRVAELAAQRGARVHLPPLKYCTDNAAMIALAGLHLLKAGQTADHRRVPFATGG